MKSQIQRVEAIQMKASGHCFPVMLFMVYRVVLTRESVDQILK